MADRAPRLGDPLVRVDARAKVTGQAAFPSDVPAPGAAHAVLLTSTVARGTITAVESARAEAVPGFLLLLTHRNTAGEVRTPRAFIGASTPTVEGPAVAHEGQVIGLLVAETLEAAREAADLVRFRYDEAEPAAGFDAPGATDRPVSEVNPRHEDPRKGDAQAALTAAAVRVDQRYATPIQHHNAIELFTTTCWWKDGRLTVHEPSQFVLDRGYLAECFRMPVEDIRVVSRFCGGGFGGKTSGTPRTVLCAIAARRLNRPVKLAATRDQGFTINTYRAETRHRVALGAAADGRLTALVHQGWEVASRPSPYTVAGTEATARLYACPNIATEVRVVQADRNTPGFMRCPAELPYLFALESAMDELACALDLDPVELRRRNDTQADPVGGLPYTSRSLMACLDEGARRFGWSDRPLRPRSMRDGDWLVGWGCASAVYPAVNGSSAARVTLEGGWRARVQVAFHEIGNGAYTVVAQTAAALLGLPIRAVGVELGDTLLPPGNIAAASNGTATTCNAVANACREIVAKLAAAAVVQDGPLRGADPAAMRAVDGFLEAGARRETLATATARLGGVVEVTASQLLPDAPPGALERLARGIPSLGGGFHGRRHVAAAFGAHFVEARVHRLTGEVRVPRAVGAFAAGRIVNARTARSQLTGGMIWGLGSALFEQTLLDGRSARYLNDNLAEYLVATNADIGSVDAFLVDEADAEVNAMGIKGVGELGCSGINAAVANAVYHATGVRRRSLPIGPSAAAG